MAQARPRIELGLDAQRCATALRN